MFTFFSDIHVVVCLNKINMLNKYYIQQGVVEADTVVMDSHLRRGRSAQTARSTTGGGDMSHVILQNSITSSSGSVGVPTGYSTSTHSKSAVVATTGRTAGRSLSLVAGALPRSLTSFSVESTWNNENRYSHYHRSDIVS